MIRIATVFFWNIDHRFVGTETCTQTLIVIRAFKVVYQFLSSFLNVFSTRPRKKRISKKKKRSREEKKKEID